MELSEIEKKTLYSEFQKLVIEYMSKFPMSFSISFEEFEEEDIDLESLWIDENVIFRVNTKGWKGDIKFYAKMAILMFLDDYFKISNTRIILPNVNLCFQAITYLIP